MPNFNLDIQTIVIVLAAISYAISTWRNSRFKGSKELLDSLTSQLTAQDIVIKGLQDANQKNVQEIGRLNGIISQLEIRIREQTDIITNRNPELEKNLLFIAKSADTLLNFTHEVRKHWEKEEQFLVSKIKP